MWDKCVVLLVVSFILCSCAPLPPAQVQGEKTVGINEVIIAVGEAIEEAQYNNVPGFPPLKSVDITLSVIASRDAGAKLKILVFSIGGGISGEDASTITLKMEPPTTKPGAKASAVDPKKYKMALAAAINVAKAGVVAAKQSLPQLITSNIEIEVAFTVKGQADGGISIEPIGVGDLVVGAGVTGKLSKSQVHKLKLVFGKGSA